MRPGLATHVVLPLAEALAGRPTFRVLRGLRTSERLPRDRLAEIQHEKLVAIVGRTLRRPGYAALADLPPEWRPDRLEDLSLLPLTTRRDLADGALGDDRVPGGMVPAVTGGSTGEPLRFLLDRRRQAFDRAARMRANGWWGIAPGDREVYVWGSPIETGLAGPLRRLRDRSVNDLLLPAFELSESRAPAWFARIARYRPACLFGYPSTLSLFCRMLLRRGLGLSGVGLKAVVVTGEVLLPGHREAIETCTGAPVVNQYGARDAGLVAQECPEGGLHVSEEGVLVEIVSDGRRMPVGEEGEIVVTHLEGRATPFLRYRTGDLGRLSGTGCGCGRTLRLLAGVRGRTTDFVVTPDGRWLHGLALVYEIRAAPGVASYRIDQIDLDEVRVRIVPGAGFADAAVERIERRLVARLGEGVRVRVETVAEIAPSASGKHRFVVSEIARERAAAL